MEPEIDNQTLYKEIDRQWEELTRGGACWSLLITIMVVLYFVKMKKVQSKNES